MRKINRNVFLWFLTAWLLSSAGSSTAAGPDVVDSTSRVILAHYLPWFEAKPVSQAWGWHWTMDAFDAEKVAEGKRQIASHFYPLIGPYDSADPHVLEYHLLLMKLAGIDGVIVDWYGRQDFRDHAMIHRNAQRLLDQANQLGMKFAICYEDRAIPALVKAGRLAADRRVACAAEEIEWLAAHWFKLPCYLRVEGRPILLSFGQTGLTDDEWSQCLALVTSPVAYFSEHHRRASAVGAFDWPIPKQGLTAIARFQNNSRAWRHSIPVAFPRFVDVYAEANVQDSWGRISDDRGATFRTSLTKALENKTRVVQVATWNDWGEGTMIEPSREFGYRDLEVIQEMRRRYIDARFKPTVTELRLPYRLLQLRRAKIDGNTIRQLDRIAELLAAENWAAAEQMLQALEQLP